MSKTRLAAALGMATAVTIGLPGIAAAEPGFTATQGTSNGSLGDQLASEGGYRRLRPLAGASDRAPQSSFPPGSRNRVASPPAKNVER